MKRRVLVLASCSVLLSSGCRRVGGPTEVILEPTELCIGQPGSAVVTMEDANLESVVRGALGLAAQEDLTCDLASGLTVLMADSSGISSLVGIQNLAGLATLWLRVNTITDLAPLGGLMNLTELRVGANPAPELAPLGGLTSLVWLGLGLNTIVDIDPLAGLTNLEVLNLGFNSIIDVTALGGLTTLTTLKLEFNRDLADIQPLLDNSGLGIGDAVRLQSTSVSCPDVARLQDRGVTVESDCP